MSTRLPSTTARNARRRKKQKASKRTGASTKPAKFYNVKKLQIGDCTRLYGKALVNPFSDFPEGPCIPDTISMASYKVTGKARGVFSTGGQGVGFVAFNPFSCINDAGMNTTGIDIAVVSTNVNYNQAAIVISPLISLSGQGLNGVNLNTNLSAVFMAGPTGRQMRLVGAGIRIRYVGSSFRNQGRIVLHRQVGNIAPDYLTGATTPSSLLHSQTSRSVPVSRSSEYVYYVPDNPSLLGYAEWAAYEPSLGVPDRRGLIIAIDGGDISTPQSWEFEAVAHYEVIGPDLTQTMSSSDVQGLGAVLSSVSGSVPTKAPTAEESSLWQKVAKSFDKETTRLIESSMKVGVNAAAFAGASYLSSRLRGPAIMAGSGPTVTEI